MLDRVETTQKPKFLNIFYHSKTTERQQNIEMVVGVYLKSSNLKQTHPIYNGPHSKCWIIWSPTKFSFRKPCWNYTASVKLVSIYAHSSENPFKLFSPFWCVCLLVELIACKKLLVRLQINHTNNWTAKN